MSNVTIRSARTADLPSIVALIAEDEFSSQREDATKPLHPKYLAAFKAIYADPQQLLAVAVFENEIVGTIQITFIPGIARLGAWRGQIEAIYVAPTYVSSGLRRHMVRFALDECKLRGCDLVQLASDKRRTEAHQTYEQLGFAATHEGYRVQL